MHISNSQYPLYFFSFFQSWKYYTPFILSCSGLLDKRKILNTMLYCSQTNLLIKLCCESIFNIYYVTLDKIFIPHSLCA